MEVSPLKQNMPNIRIKKRSHTYSFAFETGVEPDGKRKVIEKGGFPTEEEARAAGETCRDQWMSEKHPRSIAELTVQDYLDWWVENREGSRNISEKSLGRYRQYVKAINQEIGHLTLQTLDISDIEDLLERYVSKGVSYTTIRVRRDTLSRALEYAVHPLGLLRMNPVVKNLKIPLRAPKSKDKKQHVTREDYDALLQKYPEVSVFRAPIAILYHTGLQIRELLALRWKDVDLRKGILHVLWQLDSAVRARSGLIPSSDGARHIPMPPELVSILEKWKEIQEIDPVRNPEGFICTLPDKKPMGVKSLSAQLGKDHLNASAFQSTHPDDLRKKLEALLLGFPDDEE